MHKKSIKNNISLEKETNEEFIDKKTLQERVSAFHNLVLIVDELTVTLLKNWDDIFYH